MYTPSTIFQKCINSVCYVHEDYQYTSYKMEQCANAYKQTQCVTPPNNPFFDWNVDRSYSNKLKLRNSSCVLSMALHR